MSLYIRTEASSFNRIIFTLPSETFGSFIVVNDTKKPFDGNEKLIKTVTSKKNIYIHFKNLPISENNKK